MMSLDKRLKKSKDKGEEKIITLRMSQNKVTLLEMLAKHYEVTLSSLVREMIDDAIVELQKDLLVLSEEAGSKGEKGGEPFTYRYFPDIVEIIVPELHAEPRRNEFNNSDEYDAMQIKAAELSVKYGTLSGSSFIDSKGNEHNIGGMKK